MSRFSFTILAFFAVFCSIKAQNLERIGHLSYAPRWLAGCWHHVDQTGREWALVATNTGLSIVDMDDPTQPVERFVVPGALNGWREVRTWAGYAYVCSEAQESGITIVNLNHLPDSIEWKNWYGSGFFEGMVKTGHTLQTADGHLYLFGGQSISQGAVIISLLDPWNPKVMSKYAANYVHDGYLRGDTLWTSEFYAGQFGVVDISDKSNPVLLATHPTPFAKSHNAELSEDGKTLFTTDEIEWGPVAAFDVSDLNNITLLDLYRPSPKPSGEVHNVRMMPGDFIVCPSYKAQLTIVDASQPDNLIEIAWDTLGTTMVWDADPYLPSGILFATSRHQGLFVYQPTYAAAARIQGMVTDATTGLPLINAKVFVLNTPNADTTMANGVYKTGAATSGNYAIRVERAGYQPQVVTNVALSGGENVTRNFALFPLSTDVATPEAELDVEVSPSPFEDRLQVEIRGFDPAVNEPVTLRLSDISGKTWMEKQAHSIGTTVLDGLTKLPSGTYLLQVSIAGRTLRVLRVVKA